MAAHSGHCLAAGNPKYTDGHRINQHVCADADNQLWFLTRRHGHYTIRNKQTGRCLEVPAGAGGDVNLQVYRCHSGANQRFLPSTVGKTDLHIVRSLGTARCLDIPNASPSNGVSLQQSSCHGGPARQLSLTSLPGGTYQVRPGGSDRCLETQYGVYSDGVTVRQHACEASSSHRYNQLWRLSR